MLQCFSNCKLVAFRKPPVLRPAQLLFRNELCLQIKWMLHEEGRILRWQTPGFPPWPCLLTDLKQNGAGAHVHLRVGLVVVFLWAPQLCFSPTHPWVPPFLFSRKASSKVWCRSNGHSSVLIAVISLEPSSSICSKSWKPTSSPGCVPQEVSQVSWHWEAAITFTKFNQFQKAVTSSTYICLRKRR